jgi:LPPG:FO 2-phospho-L-lactate transferase
MILALAGGVGGAKLAAGLQRVLGPSLTVAVNTGDDFEHLGFCISPDLDTVMYTLAGLNNTQTGWGLAGETWSFMAMLAKLGGETWFNLGDHDLATHAERTRRLRAGESLSSITAALCARLGLRARIVPMSDDPIRTVVVTDQGDLAFQHYFVRLRCEPVLKGLRFEGVANARPSPGFVDALEDPQLEGIVICPSNPYLSVDPILAVPGIRDRLAARRSPCAAVSPIVGGQAIKGPAAKILRELGREVSALEVARHYVGFVDLFVLDNADAAMAGAIRALGLRTLVTDTLMRDTDVSERLSREVLAALHR